MAENDATNGHTEAATDLEKKIIKQIEVSKTITRRSGTFISCLLHQKSDLQAILLLFESVFKLNSCTWKVLNVVVCASFHFDLILLTKLFCMHQRIP